MPRALIDLLWRDHPRAQTGGRRGPRSRVSTATVVEVATRLAGTAGLPAVTIRALAAELDVSTMSIYTHVNSRDDLLVLMADAAHGTVASAPFGRQGWRARVRHVAEANRALLSRHPWLLDVDDERVALGPGTIAKYDHELQALAPLRLDEVAQDAALTFVLDFVRASVRAARPDPRAGALEEHWAEWGPRLADYLGSDYPLAQRVGAAAGEAQRGVRDPEFAWRFGLSRVLDGLAGLQRTP
jgi:AcrR family transcriptional regulator